MKCSAHRTDGNPCNAYAIAGGTVCVGHGGRAPQVRDAARRRLLAATDPVAAELIRLALHDDDSRVRLAAARDVLDRAGIDRTDRPMVVEVHETIETRAQRLADQLRAFQEGFGREPHHNGR